MKTLYKKTSTGAIQYWTIRVYPVGSGYGGIETEYGQLNTDKPQITHDAITEGKNIGKKNETTALVQAYMEAEAKWKKQKKKGYVESITVAESNKVDEIIEGGILPMLAHKFSDHGDKIEYPCYIQPKLDGIRCVAIIKNGKATLWTRTRKRITSMSHIVNSLENTFKNENIILDGELYNHEMKNDFEKIVSLVRKDEPDSNHNIVQYHIYDTINDKRFSIRNNNVHSICKKLDSNIFKYVTTELVHNEDESMEHFNLFKNMGYEGAILRNSDGLYLNKRSYDLQKLKDFEDSEFKIIGVEEGRGKLSGHVGSFICITDDNKEFNVKLKGSTERLKEYFDNDSLWKNKLLTVRYQGLTKYGIPRFPVGVEIRSYE